MTESIIRSSSGTEGMLVSFPPIILSRCVLKSIVSVAISEAFNLEYIPVPHMRQWDRCGFIDQIYVYGESDLARSTDDAA